MLLLQAIEPFELTVPTSFGFGALGQFQVVRGKQDPAPFLFGFQHDLVEQIRGGLVERQLANMRQLVEAAAGLAIRKRDSGA